MRITFLKDTVKQLRSCYLQVRLADSLPLC